ncbi:uncharacterized protein LOC119767944 [Culex quinquefasciatus]|uniref:uncharacterized protein LOC119767944 n=1 Tax=Culex quinquefasciatus TaxID=7176 RepID=UPI0018E3F909|nr:uncharacterized protein LOC119767944 [Culex quinquefasciatus]XP_039433442.1 uncharacterized protein LOC120415871 [Culex pipiens pallens]
MKCFVPSCGIDFHKRNLCADGLVSKHRFPRDPERRLKWLDAIPNVGHLDPETINYETVRLCSKHFHRDSFTITDNKRELLASAVPAIFVDSVCDTPYYQEFYVISDGKVEVAQPSEQLYYQDPPPEVKRQRLREKTRKRSIRYAGDIDMSTLTSHEAVIMVPKLVAKLEKANKTIRALRSANRRLREKMTRVEQLIDNKFQQSVEKDKSSGAPAKTKEPGSVVRIEITPAGAGETNEEITFTDDDDDFIEEGEECVVEYEETV